MQCMAFFFTFFALSIDMEMPSLPYNECIHRGEDDEECILCSLLPVAGSLPWGNAFER